MLIEVRDVNWLIIGPFAVQMLLCHCCMKFDFLPYMSLSSQSRLLMHLSLHPFSISSDHSFLCSPLGLFDTSLFFNPHFINVRFSFPFTIFFPCQMNPNAILIYVLHIDSSLRRNSHISGSLSLHHCLAECIFNASLPLDQQNVSVYSSKLEIKTEWSQCWSAFKRVDIKGTWRGEGL